jgi:PAS domain S-box-containing protein
VQSEETPDFHRWISEELFDHVPLAICVVDQRFRIVEANDRFAELYGEWRGHFCYEVYKGRNERCARCGAAKTFRDGKTRQREEEGVDRQGNATHYVVNIVPVVRDNGDVPYVIEMSRDIAELKTLQRQKLAAERLAAVGQTVAGLAHGIKNLIMGLEGGMYVVNSGLRGGNEERLLQGWKMLEEDIGRISSFVKEFLEFAKGRQPRVQTIQPNDVARAVVDRYRERALRSGVDLRLDLDEIEEASMDEEALHTCLTNLVLNAIDACVMSTKEARHVVLSTREEGGVLTFEVTDDGCGMDYDIKQKVFTNFFSTKASGKGTGLGLLTTRKIVQEHGGKVSFESAEGEGSVFRLQFPRDSLPQPQREEAAAAG